MVNDDEQVRYAVAHLKGAALDWWQHHPHGGAPSTWAAVDRGLRARFQPVTSEEIARNRLHGLEQGKSSINDYVAQFRRLIIAIPTMDAASQIHQFAHGLRPQLQMHHRQGQPASLEDAITLAVRMGTVMSGAGPSSAAAAAAGGHMAMDINALSAEYDGTDEEGANATQQDQPVSRSEFALLLAAINGQNSRGQGVGGGNRGRSRGLPRIQGLSDEKVAQYMADERCFGCHKTGHKSDKCPLKHKNAAGKTVWSEGKSGE